MHSIKQYLFKCKRVLKIGLKIEFLCHFLTNIFLMLLSHENMKHYYEYILIYKPKL